jgi:hypothetical protein
VHGRKDSRILWQRGYYEHVVRGDKVFSRLADYVVENPTRWAEDSENPGRG